MERESKLTGGGGVFVPGRVTIRVNAETFGTSYNNM